VPAETGPPLTPIALSVIALLVGALALLRPGWRAPLVLVAGAELLVWVWLRRLWLVRAVLPTELPFWLDRAATAAVAVVAVGSIGWALRRGALGPSLRPVPAVRPTGPDPSAP
jgi:hypothetical protein